MLDISVRTTVGDIPVHGATLSELQTKFPPCIHALFDEITESEAILSSQFCVLSNSPSVHFKKGSLLANDLELTDMQFQDTGRLGNEEHKSFLAKDMTDVTFKKMKDGTVLPFVREYASNEHASVWVFITPEGVIGWATPTRALEWTPVYANFKRDAYTLNFEEDASSLSPEDMNKRRGHMLFFRIPVHKSRKRSHDVSIDLSRDDQNKLVSTKDGKKELFLRKNRKSKHSVYVKTITGKFFGSEFDPYETIHHVKKMIFETQGIPPDQQRLIFDRRRLCDDLSLSHYSIGQGATLHLVLNLCGGGEELIPTVAKFGSCVGRMPFPSCSTVNRDGIVRVFVAEFLHSTDGSVTPLQLSEATRKNRMFYEHLWSPPRCLVGPYYTHGFPVVELTEDSAAHLPRVEDVACPHRSVRAKCHKQCSLVGLVPGGYAVRPSEHGEGDDLGDLIKRHPG